MIVCIAEKPSVAKDIAKVLGANVQHNGYMEGNGYQVTWTFGHLCTLKEPHDYSLFWKPWDLATLPMIPARFGIKLIPNDTYEKQFHVIERLMQKADSIINCGDAGQEGELIQRWVMQKAKATCPVQRLWISSLTEESIRDGFAHLEPQDRYQSLYEAGLCRAIGDWLLGMNATRLYTLRYRVGRQVLSIGRVQTPTLALIVKRHQEIANFKPEQYWILATRYRDVKFTSTEATNSNRMPKEYWEEQIRAIEHNPFTVTGIGTKEGREAPPKLFDLTSLQVECNRKFAFSADETLKYIQNLYEKKYTTYPRVDTTYLSDDIYPKCPNILRGLLPYSSLTAPLLQKPLPKSKRVFDSSKVTDHHAIIPTGVNPSGGDLTYNEKRVFDTVARRFIAVFYPDCTFLTTTVMGEVAITPQDEAVFTLGEEVKRVKKVNFKTQGKQIVNEGWHTVYGGIKKNNDDTEEKDTEKDDDNQVLPAFVQGEQGPHTPMLTERWTTPPKYYTEATLLRAMETAGKTVDNEELRDLMKENGIGRPSTRAAIIELLQKRDYVRKQGKNLMATPTGIDLIGIIREELLKSAELTGQWEKKLRDIENHKYDSQQFIAELKQMVIDIVAQVMADTSNRRIAQTPEVPAKKGTKGAKSKSSDTPDAKKSRAPRTPKDPTAKKSSRSRKGAEPTETTPPPVTPPNAPALNPATPQLVEGAPCPICGKGHIIRGKTAFGCSEWKSGCPFRAPFSPSENQ